jgi:hypothetical protein
MSHLTLETLARLVDEPATAEETAHLAACGECASELAGLRSDLENLGALPDLMPPPRAWAALEARLETEGLIHAGRLAARGRHRWGTALTQLAAAVVLVGLGTGLGAFALAPRLVPPGTGIAAAGSPAPAPGTPGTPADANPVAVGPGAVDATDEDAAAGGLDPALQAPPVRRNTPAAGGFRLASAEQAYRAPRTADEALAVMREAEFAYLNALTRYAELAGGVPGGDPMARLAALEGIVLTTRAALGQAPADPVINGYHMTALAQREATLRQIAANTVQSWF